MSSHAEAKLAAPVHLINEGGGSSTKSFASYSSEDTEPTNCSDLSRRNQSPDRANTQESASTSTYTSPASSSIDDELAEGPEPQYEVMERIQNYQPSQAFASDPVIFANLFPSSRRLLIRHDDSTLDGNMNLRIDTPITQAEAGYQQDVTLFHLRVYDLYSRKFSLRRYCRSSGREVCHTSRKLSSSSLADKGRLFRQSWNGILSSLRPRYSNNDNIGSRRTDLADKSGYGSHDQFTAEEHDHNQQSSGLSDTMTLEFCNYAHVELRQRGSNGPRNYEYWSTRYQWRRRIRKQGDIRNTSYHLVNMKKGKIVAHIVPNILTPLEAIEEASKGGWVPPSSMWINDASVYGKMPDIAE